MAVIDGLFKGKITATEQVMLENHALVIGEINTPILTIRGGAIIEGQCYFDPREHVELPLERWEPPGMAGRHRFCQSLAQPNLPVSG